MVDLAVDLLAARTFPGYDGMNQERYFLDVNIA